MALFRVGREPRGRQGRASPTAPLLVETMDFPGPVRRMNRFLAVVAVFGAFGTVALALALTPEAQTSASHAKGSPDAVATIEPEEAAPAAAPISTAAAPPTQENTFEIAMRPQRAEKSDRLARSFRTPSPELQIARHAAFQRALQSSGRTSPGPAQRLAPEPSQVPSQVPVPGDTSPDASADDIDEITEVAVGIITGTEHGEAVADAAEEAAEDVAEDAAEEATEQAAVATRSAVVSTDVNMRARPANGAAVVVVVPRRSEVEVIGCDYWCEVMYAGKRGFIYKGFVRGAS
jgi:hypothetical protein